VVHWKTCAEGDADGDANRSIANPIVVEKILGSVSARRDGSEEGAHHLLGVIKQGVAGALHPRKSVTPAELLQASDAGVAGRELRAQVALTFLGSTNVVQQEREEVTVEVAAAHNLTGGIRNPSW